MIAISVFHVRYLCHISCKIFVSYLYDSRGDQSKSVNCPEEDCVFKYGNILVKDLNKGNSNNVV